MNYRFHCPHCGHGQESPFVRIGAQVACPRCEEVFRIEIETLEGGSGGGLGAAAGRRPAAGSGGEDAESPLGGQEPEALVGLSGLSGLMHEAADAEGEEGDAGDGPFPNAGSFKGAAESGAGVDASAALGMDDTPPTPPRAPAPPHAGVAVPPPPTRDMLRRQRQRDREEAEADAAKRRRVVMLAAVGLGLAIALALVLVVLLGGEAGTPPASVPPAPPAATAPEAEEDASPLAEEPLRVVYARGVEPGTKPGAPERRPGIEGAAEATPDPLGQTRRLEVTLTATGDAVEGPLRLHLEADAPGSPAWSADVPAGLAAGQTRRITVALVPPLPTTVEGWSVTPFR